MAEQRKFLFKAFPKSMSAIGVPPDAQNLLRELAETVELHSSVIEQLAEKENIEFQEASPGGGGGSEPVLDEVELILHQEIFGQDP